MRKKKAFLLRSHNVTVAIIVGAAVALAISLALGMGVAKLFEVGSVPENDMVSIFFVRALSVIVGCLVGTFICDKRALLIIGGISGMYLAFTLAIGGVILDGALCNLLPGVLSVLSGTASAMIIKLKPQRGRRKTLKLLH